MVIKYRTVHTSLDSVTSLYDIHNPSSSTSVSVDYFQGTEELLIIYMFIKPLYMNKNIISTDPYKPKPGDF